MKIKVALIALVLTVFVVQSCGQESPGTIYVRINKAYQDKDFQLLLSLYEDGAFYLNPDGRIMTNKEQFLAPIKALFEEAEAEGLTLAMNHRVVNRDYVEGSAIDIGYYKLDKLDEKGIVSTVTGKFMTVARKQTDGSWKFRAESFSDAPLAAFLGN